MGSDEPRQQSGSAALRAETIEPRILLSATWVDGADIDAAEADEVEIALPAALDQGTLPETVLGTKKADTLELPDPVAGEAYFVDGLKGDDRLDLSSFTFAQASFREGGLTIDLGDGESFTVDYQNLEQMEFADESVRLLQGDARGNGLTGSVTFVDGDEVFRLTVDGGGSVDWSWDSDRDTLQLRDLEGTDARSSLRLERLAGDDLRVGRIELDTSLGALESDVGIESLTIGKKASLGSLTAGGPVDTLVIQGDLSTTTTLDADIGTLRVGDDVLAGASLHVRGQVDTLQADRLMAGSAVRVDAAIGSVTLGRIDAGATLEFGDSVGTLLLRRGALAGDVAIHGDAGAIDITASGTKDDLAGTLTVDGSLGSLRVGDDLLPGARVVVHGDLGQLEIGDVVQRNALVQVDGDVDGTLRVGRIDAGARVEVDGDVTRLEVGRELNGRVEVGGDLVTLSIGRAAKGEVLISALDGELRIEHAGKVVTAHADGPCEAIYDVGRRTLEIEARATAAGAAPRTDGAVDLTDDATGHDLGEPEAVDADEPEETEDPDEEAADDEEQDPEAEDASPDEPQAQAPALSSPTDLRADAIAHATATPDALAAPLPETPPDASHPAELAPAALRQNALRALTIHYGNGGSGGGDDGVTESRAASAAGTAASAPEPVHAAPPAVDSATSTDADRRDAAVRSPPNDTTVAPTQTATSSAGAGEPAQAAVEPTSRGFLLELWAGLLTFLRGHADHDRKL